MTPEEFKVFKQIRDAEPLIGASQVAGSDRTLMLGYNLDRQSVHVYLEGGLIHRVVATAPGEVLEHRAKRWWLARNLLVDQKRWYPEACDQEFSLKLVRAGGSPCFTAFGIARQNGVSPRSLARCDCPMGEGFHWMA